MDFDLFTPPPEYLGERYRLKEPLGEGGSGIVRSAIDERSGAQVAVKLVEASVVQRPLRFLAEARDMARIRHPRVVRVFDAGRQGRWYWTVMELMRGGSLKDLVEREGPCAPERALRLAFYTLQGLSAVHQASLVHRDIKPHNVLLDEHGLPKITDFGLARHEAGDVPYKTRTGESLGSPSYRAPEQTNNPASAGREADIYGVGATVYFLLTGERPPVFYAISNDEILSAFSSLSPSIAAIIKRATLYRARDRYQTAFEMASDVANAYDTLPSREGQPPVAARWLADFDSVEESKPGGLWSWLKSQIR